jgi:SAM-dependent methyltransferase
LPNEKTIMDADFWDRRYQETGWAFGTEPNDFLRAEAGRLPQGRVLCLAEGEGRNAVHLAGLGYQVEAVDQSAAGLAKTALLAARRGVQVRTRQADLAVWDLGRACWQGIVAIFLHLPMPLRRDLHRRAVAALAPGGVLLAETYAPDQIRLGTGGPNDPGRLCTLEDLLEDFRGLEWQIARALRREVREGRYHDGLGSVIQLAGRKP